MKYSLENAAEGARLEEQATYRAYDLVRELETYRPPRQGLVLDAGCGTGLVARHLTQKFPELKVEGCDASDLRLAEARKLSLKKIRYFQSDLDRVPCGDGHYDGIVCRYVFEHLSNVAEVSAEFLRILKPGGKLRIINFDGILFNLSTPDVELNRMFKELESKWKFDLFIGRKIPGLLQTAGFKNVTWTVEACGFSGRDLETECDLTKKRLQFALRAVEEALGNERAGRFCDLYLREMTSLKSTLFYNKFIVEGEK